MSVNKGSKPGKKSKGRINEPERHLVSSFAFTPHVGLNEGATNVCEEAQ